MTSFMTSFMTRRSSGGLFLFGFFLSLMASAQSTLQSPNVSANVLLLGRQSNFANDETNTVRNGFDLQEAELAFYADVDPYINLNLIFALHPEYEYDPGASEIKQSWIFEPEELYAETLHIPSVTLKLGKFKGAIAKQNLRHSHSSPFVDLPFVHEALLGPEGLNDVGLSAGILLPSSWFSELTLQTLRGEGENLLFNSKTPNDFVGVYQWRNLWDLSDDLTFELGASYAEGQPSVGGVATVWAGHGALKWRPAEGGKYRSWTLETEALSGRISETREAANGVLIWGKYQFAQQWAAWVRYDNLEIAQGGTLITSPELLEKKANRTTLAMVYSPTEFSSYRFEYSNSQGPLSVTGESVETKYYLQANFTIGAHPAHAY